MIKLSLLVRLLFIWSSTLIALNYCEDTYQAIYMTPGRSSSIVYGKFKSLPTESDDESNNLIESIVDCKFVNHPKIGEILHASGKEMRKLMKTIENVDQFDELIENCEQVKLTPTIPLAKWKLFGFSNLLIAPGTKWCGAGNSSTSYDDLGWAVETDKCCRTHDHCELNIKAGASRFNLTNTTPFTVSHCDCDEQLKDCLREATKIDVGAGLIGSIFFNVMKFKCFREIVPEKDCLEWEGNPWDATCVRRAEIEPEPVWTMFDAVPFS